MSGHSKWHNIQQAKGKADAARGKIFTKIGREIAVAVKAGGPDPNANAALRAVIDKAKANNMPKDNITRSIQKASGELGSINYESIVYEGYGTNGVAIIVEALTDNKQNGRRYTSHFRSFGRKSRHFGLRVLYVHDQGCDRHRKESRNGRRRNDDACS